VQLLVAMHECVAWIVRDKVNRNAIKWHEPSEADPTFVPPLLTVQLGPSISVAISGFHLY
jgi:hypothetical protein